MLGWFRRFRLPPPPLVLFRCPSASAFLFPCLFRVCPFRARCVVLVFSLTLFFCVPLFASWFSKFHFIFIVISLSFSFHLPRCGGACVCVYHLYRCKTSIYCRGAGTHDCLSWPTKTRQHGGESVPAIFQFFVNGNRLSQEPACQP